MNRPVFLLLLSLCSGCVSYPIYDRQLSREQIGADRKEKIPLTVVVAAAPAGNFKCIGDETDSEIRARMWKSIHDLVHDLKATGLFRDVSVLSATNRADLIAESREASGCAKCGTPFLMREMTLGLLSAETSYGHYYSVRFLSPTDGRSVQFSQQYEGVLYGPSILVAPFTVWQARTTEIDLLRHDLLIQAPELRGLSGKR